MVPGVAPFMSVKRKRQFKQAYPSYQHRLIVTKISVSLMFNCRFQTYKR